MLYEITVISWELLIWAKFTNPVSKSWYSLLISLIEKPISRVAFLNSYPIPNDLELNLIVDLSYGLLDCLKPPLILNLLILSSLPNLIL